MKGAESTRRIARSGRAMGYFVAGTDTEIGKTLVSCALLRAFGGHGLRAVGMKPVAAGARHRGPHLVNDDVEQLAAASSIRVLRDDANPYCFAAAIAPHIAAARAGVRIDCARIVRAYRRLEHVADVVIVEGVGGLRVPLNTREDAADLARRLALPVILVVGIRLGCLSQALLTVEALRARRLRLAGWVANRIDPRMACADENVEALRQRIAAPLLANVPHLRDPDPCLAAKVMNISVLTRRPPRARG